MLNTNFHASFEIERAKKFDEITLAKRHIVLLELVVP
jgi:hypothetical protein